MSLVAAAALSVSESTAVGREGFLGGWQNALTWGALGSLGDLSSPEGLLLGTFFCPLFSAGSEALPSARPRTRSPLGQLPARPMPSPSATGGNFQLVARGLLCIKPYMSDKMWSHSEGTELRAQFSWGDAAHPQDIAVQSLRECRSTSP